MKMVLVLLVVCLSFVRAGAKVLVSDSYSPSMNMGLSGSPTFYSALYVYQPFGGHSVRHEVFALGGLETTPIELDISQLISTNSGCQAEMVEYESQGPGYQVNTVLDSGTFTLNDGDAIGIDAGAGTVGGQPDGVFFQTHAVMANATDTTARLANAAAIGFAGGCPFWAVIAGFTIVRSYITQKEDI